MKTKTLSLHEKLAAITILNEVIITAKKKYTHKRIVYDKALFKNTKEEEDFVHNCNQKRCVGISAKNKGVQNMIHTVTFIDVGSLLLRDQAELKITELIKSL